MIEVREGNAVTAYLEGWYTVEDVIDSVIEAGG